MVKKLLVIAFLGFTTIVCGQTESKLHIRTGVGIGKEYHYFNKADVGMSINLIEVAYYPIKHGDFQYGLVVQNGGTFLEETYNVVSDATETIKISGTYLGVTVNYLLSDKINCGAKISGGQINLMENANSSFNNMNRGIGMNFGVDLKYNFNKRWGLYLASENQLGKVELTQDSNANLRMVTVTMGLMVKF